MSDRKPPSDHLPDEPQDEDVPTPQDAAPRPGGPDLSEFARLDAEEPAPPSPDGPSIGDFMSPGPAETNAGDEAEAPLDPEPAVAAGPDLSEFMRLEEETTDDRPQTTEDRPQTTDDRGQGTENSEEPVSEEPPVVPAGPDLAEFIGEEPAMDEPPLAEPEPEPEPALEAADDAELEAWPAAAPDDVPEAWPAAGGEDDGLGIDPFADLEEPAVEHGLAGDPVAAAHDDAPDDHHLSETGLVGAGFTPTDPVHAGDGEGEKVSLLKRQMSMPSLRSVSRPSLSLPSLSLPSLPRRSSGRSSRSRSSLALPASVNPRLVVLLAVAVVGVAGYMVTRGGSTNDVSAPVPSPAHVAGSPAAKAPKKAAAKPASGAPKPATAAPAAKAPAPPAGWTRVNVAGGGFTVDVPPGYTQLVTGPLVTFSTANRARAYAVNGARSESGSARAAAQKLVHTYRSQYSIIELFTHVNGSRVDISARGRRHGTAFNQRILASVVRTPGSKHGLMVIQSFSADRPRGQDRVGLAEFEKVRGTLRLGA